MIAPLSPIHGQACSLLHGVCAPEGGWSPEAFEALIQAQEAYGFFAPELVGFIIFQTAHEEGDVIYLAVAPERRRQGIGRALVQKAMVACGLKTLFLEVSEVNQGAIAFYGALGFTEAGRRKNYYTVNEKKIDGVILKKNRASGSREIEETEDRD